MMDSRCCRRGRLLEMSRRWAASVGAYLLLVSCASVSGSSGSATPLWSSTLDCFKSDVAITTENAEAAAEVCAGGSAASDPQRTGVERAYAAFNAARALNWLAGIEPLPASCVSAAACHGTALDLLSFSEANLTDTQVSSQGVDTKREKRFIQSRRLETAKALSRLAETDSSGLCGGKTACFQAASTALSTVSFGPLPEDSAQSDRRLLCDTLYLRWQVDSALAGDQSFQAMEDLSRLRAECPDLAAEANIAMADIAFRRAETIRLALKRTRPSSANASARVQEAQVAIADYRLALAAEVFELQSERGLGEVHGHLALLEPGRAPVHLVSAESAYRRAVQLARIEGETQELALDLERLGDVSLALADVSRPDPNEESNVWLRSAAEAFEESAALQSSALTTLKLAGALHRLGQLSSARMAYQRAIPGLAGKTRLEARIALAEILTALNETTAAQQVLEQAVQQDPFDASIRYELARRYFRLNDLVSVSGMLTPAIQGLSGTERAEAGFMLSVAETALRPEGWKERAARYAELSLAAATQNWRYSRHACLLAILIGGDDVKSGSNTSRCPDIATPEAQWLRAIYQLKRAQLEDVSAYDLESQNHWRSILRKAETSLITARAQLTARQVSPQTVRFDDLGQTVDLRVVIDQGLRVIQRCRREITIDPNSAEWAALEKVFGHYGVLRCSSPRSR